MIRWTDGNWAPERASYTNLCVDKTPDPSTIGIGSKVLFKQGFYWCGHDDDGSVCDSSGRTLSEAKKQEIIDKRQVSDRWHKGILTYISINENGEAIYSGRHVSETDPQVSKKNYVDYSPTFEGLTVEQLRTFPSIHDCYFSSKDNQKKTNELQCNLEKLTIDSNGSKSLVKENIPKVNDLAFVYWHGHGWFTAKIEQWLQNELNYMIRWTDGNWAPERASYNNLCVDKTPDPSTLEVGSKVLFKQGLYWCGHNDDGSVCDSSGRTLSEAKKQEIINKNQVSDRWHKGILTDISINENGETVYSGRHVIETDPQVSKKNYLDYNPTFEGLTGEQLRTFPSIHDCLDSSRNNQKKINELQCNLEKLAIDSNGSKALVKENIPKVGDIAFVYWHGHGWFTAKIEQWLPYELKYMIRWTDGKWAPERASYTNLCVDKTPDPSTLGVGSKVLFKQGFYWCGHNDDGSVCDSSGRTLSEAKKQKIKEKRQVSDRWHKGILTGVSTNANGETVYSGRHVIETDPQVSKSNYVEYCLTFEGLTVEQLRLFPDIDSYLGFPVNNQGKINELQSNLERLAITSTGPKALANENIPKVGDITFVYWDGYGWFTAEIEQWLPNELNYMIRWTDGNWAPERASYSNLCVDKTPDRSTLRVGSNVLFKQGLYWCGEDDDGCVCDESGRNLSEAKKQEIMDLGQVSDRWHKGILTDISENENGDTVYSGRHVSDTDPQVSSSDYVDYSLTFDGLTVEQLRTFPNIHSCLDSPENQGKINEPQIKSEKYDVGNTDPKAALPEGSPPRIFLSYCWTDSKSSFEAKEVKSYIGHEYSDPRKIKMDIQRKLGEKVWLDIEQLDHIDDSGMFEQIAVGLVDSSVVIICISMEYSKSLHCQMEADFVLRSLRKKSIVLEVGSGSKEDREAWVRSSVGMILPTDESPYVMTQDQIDSAEAYEATIYKICQTLKLLVLSK